MFRNMIFLLTRRQFYTSIATLYILAQSFGSGLATASQTYFYSMSLQTVSKLEGFLVLGSSLLILVQVPRFFSQQILGKTVLSNTFYIKNALNTLLTVLPTHWRMGNLSQRPSTGLQHQLWRCGGLLSLLFLMFITTFRHLRAVKLFYGCVLQLLLLGCLLNLF